MYIDIYTHAYIYVITRAIFFTWGAAHREDEGHAGAQANEQNI